MTEEEAKKKKCPIACIGVVIAASTENNVDLLERLGKQRFCIASNCMMWVWDSEKENAALAIKKEGHCGLAK